jgi:hypothetical protein
MSTHEKLIEALARAAMWLLFVGLLAPVGVAGWAVGHYT